MYSAPRLVTLLQSWVGSGSVSILVRSSRLHLDPTCVTTLDNIKAPDCPIGRYTFETTTPKADTTESDAKTSHGATDVGIIGGTIGVAALFLLAILIVILVLMTVRKWKPTIQ